MDTLAVHQVAQEVPIDDDTTCELKVYPTPDEVIFCDRRAVVALIAPCCGQSTRFCQPCLAEATTRQWSFWLCHGCGKRHAGGSLQFTTRPL